jgi:phage gpG-like protein
MATTVVRLSYNRLPELARRLPGEVRQICLETAEAIETRVKTGMAEPKSGEWYGDHQASAPGEMPAMDTGTLAGSILAEPDGGGAVVYTNMEYAAHLEYGTVNMEPRPFFTPAAEEARPGFVRALQDLERRL